MSARYRVAMVTTTITIIAGICHRLNKEPSDNEYDQTGRAFRLSVTSLGR